MPWPHDAVATTVERCYLDGLQPLGRRDNGGADRAERQVAVPGDKLGDPKPIAGAKRLDDEAPRPQVAEEADLGLPAEAGADQIGGLGDDESGDDERVGIRFEQLPAGEMMGVVSVDVGIEGAGVEDQGDGAISEPRTSLIRSEVSRRPLWPVPAARKCRRPPPAPR